MGRLLAYCLISTIIYVGLFGDVLYRPLSLGLLQAEIDQKASRLADMPTPKLVILAGSNGPYSHSCVVLQPMLALPCENAGIAVGIGLDGIFARYAPLLRPGDIVYMPMELQQYPATLADYSAGPDSGLLLRKDSALLWVMPPRRVLGAIFCCTVLDFLDSLLEAPLSRTAHLAPEKLLRREYNDQGDRIDNAANGPLPGLLHGATRLLPSAAAIASGYGTYLIARFTKTESAKGVTIIGGVPADFDTVDIPIGTIDAVSGIYSEHGGRFLALPNLSHYPVADFYNSEDHLSRPCQYAHSVLLAGYLAQMLHRPLTPPQRGGTKRCSRMSSFLAHRCLLWRFQG